MCLCNNILLFRWFVSILWLVCDYADASCIFSSFFLLCTCQHSSFLLQFFSSLWYEKKCVCFVVSGVFGIQCVTQNLLIRTLVRWHLFYVCFVIVISVTSSVCYFSISLSCWQPFYALLGVVDRMRSDEITATFITLSDDALWTISIGFLGISATHSSIFRQHSQPCWKINGTVNRHWSNIKKCLRELTTNFWHHSI